MGKFFRHVGNVLSGKGWDGNQGGADGGPIANGGDAGSGEDPNAGPGSDARASESGKKPVTKTGGGAPITSKPGSAGPPRVIPKAPTKPAQTVKPPTAAQVATTKAETAKKVALKKEQDKKANEKAQEEERKNSDEGSVRSIAKSLSKAAGDTDKLGTDTTKAIDASQKQADDATKLYKATLDEKSKMLDAKAKDIEGLSKWHQGIVTSYEDLATRYKSAVTGLDGDERKGMQNQARGDYMAMSGLGAQAAGVMNAAGGGMKTGAQQQLMGAAFQQQATGAYSSAMKNISAVDEQRRGMQFAMAQAASGDERSNRQLGFNMESGQIQQGIGVINNQAGFAGQSYGASIQNSAMGQDAAKDKYGIGLNTIGARTQANTYAPTARMALNNAGMQAGFANRSLDIQQQTLAKSGNINPWAAAGAGAAAGAPFGPWGALGGAAIGAGGAMMTNK